MKRSWMIVLLVAITIFICGCVLVSGMYGVGLWFDRTKVIQQVITSQPAEPTSEPVEMIKIPESSAPDIKTKAEETLKTLKEIELPTSDLGELAQRLEGKGDIPKTLESIEKNFQIGSQQVYWVSNVDTNENKQISTTLQYATDHAYFWIQDGVQFDFEELKALGDTFETDIYRKNRQYFGSEWTPGVDGDPHIYIIYAQGLGGSLAGYFSSADEHHPLAHEYSNAHETFVLNADNVALGSEFAYAVLAHEFQHMIHWFHDRNESSWVNEGFSELAVFLNGYEVGSEYSYIVNPDLQLNDWPNIDRPTSPHYGASFLYFTYFIDRFGEQAAKAIVMEAENGLEGIDSVLEKNDIRDTRTGELITAEDVFADWVIASYLRDEDVADGRFTYHNFIEAPQAAATETIKECPTERLNRDVHQFGVDYLQINCKGNYKLRFEGSSLVKVIPIDAYSGEYYYWSNKGDEADMMLTRNFDFTEHEGQLTLSFYTWYDIEEDYDYLYVEVSEDGENWQIIDTPSGTADDPSGNSYGWGYNGRSDAWVKESVDLSDFSGKNVFVRFEYVTDAAVHGEGFVIDDVAIPEIGYFTDFEDGDDGWLAEGWVRMNNLIPQTYRVSMITFGDTIDVVSIPLNGDQSAEIDITADRNIEHIVLVISGTSRFTRQKAGYQIQVQ